RMAPAYAELGRAMKGQAGLVVAHMDATANDVPSSDPELDVKGYPTVVLVRAGDNKVVRYQGNRSLASFTAFLQQHATRSLGPRGAPSDGAPNGYAPLGDAPAEGHDVGFSPKETRHIEL
ncbi:Protein disulfide-isomerase A4, partial [Coemansia nantahalensis]